MNEALMNEENQIEKSVTVDLEDTESPEKEVAAQPEQMFVSNENSEEDVSEGASDEELEGHSKNVQKRINQLTAKRKQSEEEAAAAYQYAKQMQAENEQLKKKFTQLDQGYVNEYATRVESQQEQAKKILKEAKDNGDVEKEIEAQDLLARLAIESERVRVQKARTEQPAQEAPQQEYVQQQQQPVQREEPLDPKLVKRMGDNDSWFNKDAVMTKGAQVIHETLVGVEGFDPKSDDYYQEIDKRMRENFPHRFQAQQQSAQAVAPASSGRSTKSGRKKSVELNPGQVAFAKKFGIPLERMAKEVLKTENRSS